MTDWRCRIPRDETREMWMELLHTFRDIHSTDLEDRCIWKLTKSGVFSISSFSKMLKVRQDV